jgi:pyruvate formate lyase activating enzyme
MKFRGADMDAEELVGVFARDREYYDASDGGVTLSGGEPAAQFEFTCEVLELSRNAGLSTCVDTCGYCPDEVFAGILNRADRMLFDIKHMDAEKHRLLTGVGNSQILRHLRMLAASGKPFRVRYPMIPGLNDDDANIGRMCALLSELKVTSIDISVFHDYYLAKYAQMFREEDAPHIRLYTQKEMDEKLETISRHGIIPNRI